MNGIDDRILPRQGGMAPRLFTARLDMVAPETLQRLSATLGDAERLRCGALRQHADRRLFELSHGLMRHAVATSLGVALDAVRLRISIGEKPRLLAPDADLDVSLTHTGDLAACAVLAGGRVGVDAERLRPGAGLSIERMLAPEERAWAAQAASPNRMLAIWTLKEAMSKAVGLGLRLEFDGFAVRPEPLGVMRAPASYPGPWHLWRDVADDAGLAVAWLATP